MKSAPDPELLSVEDRIAALGRELRSRLLAVLEAEPESERGPQRLAEALGLDKVLCSRLLKAARNYDPYAVLYHLPGPEPMRRFFRAAQKRGQDPARVRQALASVDAFQELIQSEVGDRSSLDAMLTSWLPQAKQEFELRRKQSAFKAISQLRGVSARCNYALVLLGPAQDGGRLDIVWTLGLLGIQRERPGARVKLATRRLGGDEQERKPLTLGGESADDLEGFRLDQFCDEEPARLQVERRGEHVHYLLAGSEFGRRQQRDFFVAEVNRAEIPRTPRPGRRGYVFCEATPPTRVLLFDVLVHDEVYAGIEPQLEIYDTSFEGIVDANDPARELDRLDFSERLESLGTGLDSLRASDVPRHDELLGHVFGSLAWDARRFRAYRCRIDYPLYGSQVVVAFGKLGESNAAS